MVMGCLFIYWQIIFYCMDGVAFAAIKCKLSVYRPLHLYTFQNMNSHKWTQLISKELIDNILWIFSSGLLEVVDNTMCDVKEK